MSAVSRNVIPTSSAASITRARGRAIEPPAEVVAAEPDARDLQIRAAESALSPRGKAMRERHGSRCRRCEASCRRLSRVRGRVPRTPRPRSPAALRDPDDDVPARAFATGKGVRAVSLRGRRDPDERPRRGSAEPDLRADPRRRAVHDHLLDPDSSSGVEDEADPGLEEARVALRPPERLPAARRAAAGLLVALAPVALGIERAGGAQPTKGAAFGARQPASSWWRWSTGAGATTAGAPSSSPSPDTIA